MSRKHAAQTDEMAKRRGRHGAAPAARKPSRAESRGQSWAIEEVRGNLTMTKDRSVAWYVATPQPWSFRSVADMERVILAQAGQIAALIGNTVHGRVTTRPYPVRHWAAKSYATFPDHRPGWDEAMGRAQAHMARHGQADKVVYYGVDLGRRDKTVATLARWSAIAAEREMTALNERLARVDGIMARQGFSAWPAVGHDMEWLLARSFALGCQVPVPTVGTLGTDRLDRDDLAEWTESVEWSADPLAQTVEVTSQVGARQQTSHVCVLSVSRVADIEIPEKHVPWMAKTDQLPFPVEWSFRVEPRSPAEVSKEMSRLTRRIDGQVAHWSEDHGKRPPKQLARQAARAADVEDEMRAEFTGLSTRTKGWYRVAVAGATEDEALDRAQQVIDLYDPQIKITKQLGQYHLAREFVPCEPLAATAHTRHFPVVKVAAGLPAVTAEVGDDRGFYLGGTATIASRAVTYDPWYLMEVMNRGGLVPLVGTLGSGKTTLMGLLIYWSILAGVRGVALDPAGRLQRLLTLPEIGGGKFGGRILAPLARSVDVLGGRPGSLSPYAVVPDPNPLLVRAECTTDSEDEFAARMTRARNAGSQDRRDLTMQVLRACLPVGMADDETVLKPVRAAIMRAPATRSSSASQIITALERGNAGQQEIALELKARRDSDIGAMFFADEGSQANSGPLHNEGDLFTFYNLKGLTPPGPEVPPEDYSPAERLVRPVMTLAAWDSLNLIYRSDPNDRKLFALDEAHEITQAAGGVGRTLVTKLSTDSRKNNCAALISTQNASAILGADINNFVGAAFVGRTQDDKAQRDALRMLRMPDDAGYEATLAGLSPQTRGSDDLGYREFIYSDGLGGEGGQGGMEVIRVTLEPHPDLAEVLNSTARPEKRVVRTLRGDNTSDAVPDAGFDAGFDVAGWAEDVAR